MSEFALSKYRRELYRDNITEIQKIAGMFARGFFSIVASEAGTGKTWLMQLMSCQLSLGGTILNGLADDEPPAKVLIMSGETGVDLMNVRLGRTNWGYNPKNIAVYCSLDLGIDGVPYLLNEPEGRRTFWEIVKAEKPDIIYFDTLISFHTADESRQGDMVAIYLFLARVARKANCAIVLNHHTRKRPTQHVARKLTQDDVIGSSAGVRMANAVYLITRVGNEDSDKRLVRQVKSWDKKISPFSYEFTTDEFGCLDLLVDLHIEPGYSLNDELAKLIAGFANEALFTVRDVANVLRVPNRRARYHLEKYSESGLLEKIPFGNETAYKKRTADS